MFFLAVASIFLSNSTVSGEDLRRVRNQSDMSGQFMTRNEALCHVMVFLDMSGYFITSQNKSDKHKF